LEQSFSALAIELKLQLDLKYQTSSVHSNLNAGSEFHLRILIILSENLPFHDKEVKFSGVIELIFK
jgi:hypothetical protein